MAVDLIMLGLSAGAIVLFIRRRWYRLAAAPNRPMAFPPMAGFGLYLLIWLAAMIGAEVAWSLVRNSDAPLRAATPTFQQQVMVTFGAYAAQSVCASIYALLLLRAPRHEPLLRAGRGRAALVGAGTLLLAWPVAQAVTAAAVRLRELFVHNVPPPIAHETLQAMADRSVDGWFLAMAALVVVAAPILEEVLYRGVLQESLRRLGIGPWPAILATAALFVLLHATVSPWHALLGLAVIAIGFGWVYEKTGRLTASITMHLLFNAGNLAITVLFME